MSDDELPCCVGEVHRTDPRTGQRYEFYVVGTVHTPGCSSAAEVAAVIERLVPDAVMLELDQERLDAVVASSERASLKKFPGGDVKGGGGARGGGCDEEEDPGGSRGRGLSLPSLSLPSLPYALASTSGYGADFLSGAVAAEAAGALVVLGDTKVRSLPDELRRRLVGAPATELADARRILRAVRYVSRALGVRGTGWTIAGGVSGDRDASSASAAAAPASRVRPVSFPAALASDPGKLIPLQGPAVLGGFAALTTLHDTMFTASGDGGGGGAFLATAAATAANALLSLGAILAFSRVVEVLLMERDEVLARSAARAASMSAGLRLNKLRRVRHEFTADPDATVTAAAASRTGGRSPGVPCFTLRRPLGPGQERRLNLFEPRWLALMDRIAADNGGSLEGAELGAVLGVNRRYVSREWLSWATREAVGAEEVDPLFRAMSEGVGGSRGSGGGGGFGGARSADLVLEPQLRMARVLRAAEGRRAVTGARKLEVWIEGVDGPPLEVTSLDPHPAGYLEADVVGEGCSRECRTGSRDGDKSGEGWGALGEAPPVRCVCVVGLAHCNGMVARLSEMDLEGW